MKMKNVEIRHLEEWKSVKMQSVEERRKGGSKKKGGERVK